MQFYNVRDLANTPQSNNFEYNFMEKEINRRMRMVRFQLLVYGWK